MAELVKAYIDWKVCEMGDIPSVGDLDVLYPIRPLPRVSDASYLIFSLTYSSLSIK
jgi:hypothetical protein